MPCMLNTARPYNGFVHYTYARFISLQIGGYCLFDLSVLDTLFLVRIRTRGCSMTSGAVYPPATTSGFPFLVIPCKKIDQVSLFGFTCLFPILQMSKSLFKLSTLTFFISFLLCLRFSQSTFKVFCVVTSANRNN